MKAHAVHGENRARLFADQEAGFARRQLLEFADMGVHALRDGDRLQLFGQLVDQGVPGRLCVHSLGEDLQGKDVVIAVDDEAGKKVAFAEDEPIGVGVANQLFAISQGVADPFAQQSGKVRDRAGGNHPESDLGTAGVES